MTTFSIILFLITLLPLGYLLILALASVRSPTTIETGDRRPSINFIIAIAAHNEATVIEATIGQIHELEYPSDLVNIHIVADHCTDDTVELARQAGAFVHERKDGPRTGKGSALSRLFHRVLNESNVDAVVIIDADTKLDPKFLLIMDARLAHGDQVIQGRHVISNPQEGWFPALTCAMFIIDNRFQNLGRSNLGWSAKHMGDSICFRTGVLRYLGWGKGLTEDYQLRQRLLLEGIKISYEPAAIGYGEAPLTWGQARAQRSRWLRGTRDASKQFARELLISWFKYREGALLDGALQAYLPSYSTLSILSIVILGTQLLVNWFYPSLFSGTLIVAWSIVVLLLFIYPLLGLALERAPRKAYFAILSGPFFMVWRSWLAITSRFSARTVPWVRTAHRG